MTREEAILLLKQYQGYEPMFPDGETLKHAFDLTDETVDTLLSAIGPTSRGQVEKGWKGEWKHYLPPLGAGDVQCRCTRCGRTPGVETPFCAWCGAPMTDEAVEITMQRLEVLYENHK